MKKIKLIMILLSLLVSSMAYSQKGIIKGRVYNSVNNKAIPFADILIDGTQRGTSSNEKGEFRISGLKPGEYTISCSFLGFKDVVLYEIRVSNSKPTVLNIPMIETSSKLDEVLVTSSGFKRLPESPLSLRTITATEIYRSPGGDRDISKVIQILPGVASSTSYRNDIIVRGGAPNENRFFLDGIEIPNINHFATQGSSGGPVGMINVNFIRETNFYAGAFPANRGNALSSVIELNQISGNDEKWTGNVMVGSSDLGLTLDGPISKNSSLIFSVRRSYLQFLFKFLKLPFLPVYNDIQYKYDLKIDDKNKLTFIGLGAFDDLDLNTDVNDDVSDEDELNRNNYILGNLPKNKQWNYTIGGKWTHFSAHSYQSFILSRNHLHNNAQKYQDNIEQAANLLLDYTSEEIENKFRFESTGRNNGWKWNYGVGYEYVKYTNSTFSKQEEKGKPIVKDFTSDMNFSKYSLFSQLSRQFIDDRLTLSLGFRTDFNDYSNDMNNPLEQFSPRFSASFRLFPDWSLNFNLGRYFQLPAYTVMGYRDSKGVLVNKENDVKYINSNHLVFGLEYLPTKYSKISVEGFYKTYGNYPFLVDKGISLANLGGDYGVIGNEEITSSSKGRSYGIEVLMQQKLMSSVYGIISYTWVRSEFEDLNKNYHPSSWDNKHILNITAGYKAPRNWEFGMKFRLMGGGPYTPYNRDLSSLKTIWNITRQGIADWSKLNTLRNKLSHGLDIRIDKKWYFKSWSLDLYMDIQNVYNAKIEGQPYIDAEKDKNGMFIEDPKDPTRYKLYEIDNLSGTILPSIGIMVEF